MVQTNRAARRRLPVAILLVLAIVVLFVVRLVDIQVVQADAMNADSSKRLTITNPTYAARGEIVDRDGTPLATSVMRYDITVSPKRLKATFTRTVDKVAQVVTREQAATEVAAITGQTPHDVLQVFVGDPTSDFQVVTTAVTLEQMRAVRALRVPAIYTVQHPLRIYPSGSLVGNLVGFVGTDGPLNGLEATENACIASTPGSYSYLQGGDGVQLPGTGSTTKDAVVGGTVMTTIDSDLQFLAKQALAEQAIAIGAESATATVVEDKTGKILVMADWPSVDPNNINGTTDREGYGSRAFTYAYEPGSTFKPMTASMLLDRGVAKPTDQVVVPSRWVSPEGSIITDAAAHATQQLTLAGVIQQSSNVGISQFATRLPNSVREDYMRAFGVGTPTAVGFQGESAGLLKKGNWDDQTKYNVAFGQGVSVTAAQMASIYQTIANKGVKLPLTLVTGCKHADGTVTDAPAGEGTRIVSAAAATTVAQMMEGVVTGGGLSKILTIPGYRIAAKSGTAEVAEPGRGYTGERVVSLAGFAPADDPQYSVIVTFTKPKTSKTSAAAAPTFHTIMTQVLKTFRVTPSSTPAPNLPTTW